MSMTIGIKSLTQSDDKFISSRCHETFINYSKQRENGEVEEKMSPSELKQLRLIERPVLRVSEKIN